MDRLVDDLAARIRTSRGMDGKRDIAGAVAALGLGDAAAVRVGDDCAAIPDGDGWLLLAIEGFIDAFVAVEPWFAGYCGVMVNLSDVAAMGGRPVAVVDALWAADDSSAVPVLQGLRDGAARYRVPVVGGHTNARAERGGLAVAVLGRASTLMTSFDARPGHDLVMAVDLRGAYRSATSTNWDASTAAPAERLRGDLDVLAAIAEAGLCGAAKDISMAGAVGTAGMLFEASGVGGTLDLDAVPRPDGVDAFRWLASFPSYGYLLSVAPGDTAAVLARFAARGIAAARVGGVDAGHALRIADRRHVATVWDFSESPLIGCGPRPARALSAAPGAVG
ncbi:sll0787 family AIR synthase-like protein [Lichenibacterium minor]|uniref:Sll0787 family AIR synthase-like protein n=1 Tax=Lichenibacterium minor TaxID=2316528 RepID=A0A4Q2U911_9HYPH|nr:sll0787 family AIR synthase-like protein [Lichenibacterium minor]RYC33263.1 sll0787 family AIR synthase-like protein [Lichenibacterium minor]